MRLEHSNLTQNNRATILKATLFNTLTTFFFEKKSIDISPFILSINFFQEKLSVKIIKPVLKAEILMLADEIFSIFQSKMEKMGMNIKGIEIQYK